MTHHGFDHWDPEELRDSRPGRPSGPDPNRILRRVRLFFVLSAVLALGMVAIGLRPLMESAPLVPPSTWAVAAMGLVLLVLLVLAWRNLHPRRLLVAGKRALDAQDPRQRRPKAERARRLGLHGLAMSWAAQAIALAMLPVFTGLLLQILARQNWPLLTFTGAGLVAGALYERRVRAAVHQAVDDQELRRAYDAE